MSFDLTKALEMSLEPAEAAALARLQLNKDFDVFLTVIAHWEVKQVLDLLAAPHDMQDRDLLLAQGGHQLIKKFTAYMASVEQPKKNHV